MIDFFQMNDLWEFNTKTQSEETGSRPGRKDVSSGRHVKTKTKGETS